MSCTFVNLHMHTETGSPLDGFAKSEDIIERSKQLSYNKIAVTDHGSMSGILDLYTKGKDEGIDVIPGMEAYCVNDRTVRKKGDKNAHLVLLAKNKIGYQNLLRLNFEGYKTGAIKIYDRVVPRVDLSLLKQYGAGIIASSACLAGTIPFLLKEDKEEEAKELVKVYKKIFDSFYLEVQPAGLIGEDQRVMNEKIVTLSKKTKTPIIVTLDSHYVYKEDREFHHVLLAVQSKKNIYDDTRLFFEANPLLSEEELLQEFPKEFIDNTRIIADQCDEATYLDSGKGYKIPHFQVPKDEEFEKWKIRKNNSDKSEAELYCRYKAEKGWDKKIRPLIERCRKIQGEEEAKKLRLEYKKRVGEELEVIENMKFSDYFLIVMDMLEECDRRKISRGVGRGSAGGCILSYLLDITKLDPVKYGLLFSRFLNKDRISMPDIDSDICQSRRDEIKQYLIDKYGEDKVASIATFGTMKVRAAIKDVVRSLDLGGSKSESFRLADRISKTVPDDNPEITLDEAYQGSEEFRKYCDRPLFGYEGGKNLPVLKGKTLKDVLQKFEGVTRQIGIHAAGMIISTESLIETLPMIIQNDIVAIAYDGKTLEGAGYLKLDVLGLKTLDIIDEAVQNIKKVYGEEIKGYPLDSIEFDPKVANAEIDFGKRFKEEKRESRRKAAKTYRLYRRGKTSACFQVSGSGMQGLLKNVKPNDIEDICAVLALFRPGPLGSGLTQEYAERKNGRKKVEYPHPDLEPILESTQGIVTYQEQVMRMATDIAGFTQSEADTLRKAIGKKIKALIDKMEVQFKEGGIAKGYTKELMNELWQLVVKFASYGFNKSHSMAYALTSYKMAYLKANYPAAFWAAALSHESDEKKRNIYVSEIRQTQKSSNPQNHIKLTAVDINSSGLDFVCVSPNEIRRDLVSLKGIGEAAVREIIDKRPFDDFFDFIDKVDSRKINAGAVKVLIQAGAFDSLNKDGRFTRKFLENLFEQCRTAMSKYKKKNKVKTVKGTDFSFDWDEAKQELIQKRKEKYPEYEYGDAEWDEEQICKDETKIYGVAVSSHPFDSYIKEERDFAAKYNRGYITLDRDFDTLQDGQTVAVMAIIKFKPREIACKNRTILRNYIIEDRYDTAELAVFESEYKINKEAFAVGNIIQCAATVTKKYGSVKKLTFLSSRRGKGMLAYFSTKKK